MYAIFFHGHQKIDRVARKHLATLLAEHDKSYPNARKILHFEGKRGPDAARLKQTNHEQPWHFVNPFDPYDKGLAGLVQDHFTLLVQALKDANTERAAFESAWLAHALVDGLTPAHHYPYEETLQDLRGGDDRQTRQGLVGRAYVKGENAYESLSRSLKLVGPGGLLTSHALFEAGVFTIMMPLRLKQAIPDEHQIALMQKLGVVKYFRRAAKEVAAFDLYERYLKKGWTPQLTRDVRRELVVRMVSVVTLAWYTAAAQAGIVERTK